MIKVLFDHEIFSEQRFGGISRYFANLASEMNKGKTIRIKISVLYCKNYYLSKFPQLFNNSIGRWLLRKEPKRYYWNKKFSKIVLKNSNFDIFHSTYYHTYSLPYNKKPLVITVHDMIHENNPEMYINSDEIINQKKQMMDASNAIIAISNFTKNEILKFYPQFKSKITVVYHGLPNKSSRLENTKIIQQNNFILFVGHRENYKNFNILAKALVPILNKDKTIKLICTGGDEFSEIESALLAKLGITEQCERIDADDETLTMLYQNALVFAYPSVQEGFGLPMLEAFTNNCPIVCSNASCLPEIGGDAVQYFNPENESSILDAVEKVIYNRDYANELIIKGQKRLTHFTMAKCIENTTKVYKSVLEN